MWEGGSCVCLGDGGSWWRWREDGEGAGDRGGVVMVGLCVSGGVGVLLYVW